MKNKLPDNLHNMATEEKYSALMVSYIEDMASAEKPTIDQDTLLEMLEGIKSEAVAVVDGKRVGTDRYPVY